MAGTARPTPQELADQVTKYVAAQGRYRTYAAALKRVLENGCRPAIPEVLVQAREKSVASFAEKCVRKWANYRPDPATRMTDLCGARIIVQTLAQVRAARQFIESNFTIVESDDKTSRLSEDRFGYRDMHYLVQVKPERASSIGFTADELTTIDMATAEVQVRSIVQHAWADILHDRMYKAPLKLSAEAKRTGALLAAIMEEGDKDFDKLAGELDQMAANYSAYVEPGDVDNEIATQKLLLQTAQAQDKPAVSLRLARLVASKGNLQEAIAYLVPHESAVGPAGLPIRLELGSALCRQHRHDPTSADYARGQRLLAAVVHDCEHPETRMAPHLMRDRSIHGRAHARQAWSYLAVPGEGKKARDNYREAVELEPRNPYYLADMLGCELRYGSTNDVAKSFRSVIREAFGVCRQHSATGTELPWSFFTAGRLALLLQEYDAALVEYAKGVHHCVRGDKAVVGGILDDETTWLRCVCEGQDPDERYRWVERGLALAKTVVRTGNTDRSTPANQPPAALLVIGAAESLPKDRKQSVADLLRDALSVFEGTVYSGGTTSGVPGAVGIVAADLKAAGAKHFRLISYIPRSLPHHATKDPSYDELIPCEGKEFSADQVLKGWEQLLASGIRPDQVLCIGYGGGPLSRAEYCVALALGATVAIVRASGGAADEILGDPFWSADRRSLLPVPADAKTLRALVAGHDKRFSEEELSRMAEELHRRYLSENAQKIEPPPMRPWPALPPLYRRANLTQAAYAIQILRAAGFEVRKVEGTPAIFRDFTPEDVELMAELEHGRWNIERLREGWRYFPVRNESERLHPCLVPWAELPDGEEGVKQWDRNAVEAFPEVLAMAKLEVYRK